jgi:hypothetical protein
MFLIRCMSVLLLELFKKDILLENPGELTLAIYPGYLSGFTQWLVWFHRVAP